MLSIAQWLRWLKRGSTISLISDLAGSRSFVHSRTTKVPTQVTGRMADGLGASLGSNGGPVCGNPQERKAKSVPGTTYASCKWNSGGGGW